MQPRRWREQGGGRAHGEPAGRGEREAAARKQAWKSCRFSAAAAEGKREIEYSAERVLCSRFSCCWRRLQASCLLPVPLPPGAGRFTC